MSELNDPRVLFAAERTLLAWNRTSLALIGFGFLIEKSDVLIAGGTSTAHDDLASLVGLGFILLGVVAVFFSSRQYMNILSSLKAAELPLGYSAKFGLLVNVVVGLLGMALAVTLYLGRG